MSADTTRGRTCELDLSIIIVAYDVRELLLRCIESVAAALDGLRAEIWVVDNGSSLDSWDALLERHDVRVLRGAASLGFGRANNLAAGQARGRALLFLNPDTELPPGGVRCLLERLESEPTLGIVGPRLVLPDGSPDPAARRSFPTPVSAAARIAGLPRRLRPARLGTYNLVESSADREAVLDAVSGACMLVRRSAFEAIGGFDPGFFMYGEDLDFAYRARQAGWRTLYFPRVRVRHWKRQSSSQRRVRSRFEFYRAMWRYYHKHRAADPVPWKALVSAAILMLGAAALARRLAGRLLGAV